MNILITSAATPLAQALANHLSGEHTVKLTDLVDVETEHAFEKNELSHEDKTEEMVDVVVRMEDAVAPGDVLPENLLPEIGRCVDQKYPLHASGIREPGRRACTGSRIARIIGVARCTVACDCRDASRGA